MRESKFTTFPNQKILEIVQPTNKSNTFGIIQIEADAKAVKELSKNAYSIWVYFSLNQDGYTFALSCADICEKRNLSESTYHRSIKELIEKGYIKLVKGNYYKFFCLPEEEPKEDNNDALPFEMV